MQRQRPPEQLAPPDWRRGDVHVVVGTVVRPGEAIQPGDERDGALLVGERDAVDDAPVRAGRPDSPRRRGQSSSLLTDALRSVVAASMSLVATLT
jgi:hypothetical protein